jgi:tol-pal system protein YbgF
VLIAVLVTVVGCAGDPALRGQLSALEKRLDESQRREATAQKKLEELEDRVFLLTDQVESQKVASDHRATPPPRLPVVALHPTEEPADDGSEVVFEGDARVHQPEIVRPSLHFDAAPRPRAHAARVAEPPPPPSPTDNLGVAPAPRVGGEPRAVDDPLKLYRVAQEDLRAGRHDAAERGFRDFLRRFPRHDYADNAQYWLGECFYDRKLFAQAAVEFRAVVAHYPLGNKAPDALLKLAFCLLATGERDQGRELLAQVPATYPRSEAARLAEERLAELAAPAARQKEGPK